jgi:hypothetical protein
VFKENGEVRNKRIRKRKAIRLNSSDSRGKWKTGLKTVVKQRDYAISGKKDQTNPYDDIFCD